MSLFVEYQTSFLSFSHLKNKTSKQQMPETKSHKNKQNKSQPNKQIKTTPNQMMKYRKARSKSYHYF